MDSCAERRSSGQEGDDQPSREKYSSRNSIGRYLIRNFFSKLGEILDMTEGKLLDVGAGAGDAYTYLSPEVKRRGVVAVEPNGA
jgi:hypothetical protein